MDEAEEKDARQIVENVLFLFNSSGPAGSDFSEASFGSIQEKIMGATSKYLSVWQACEGWTPPGAGHAEDQINEVTGAYEYGLRTLRSRHASGIYVLHYCQYLLFEIWTLTHLPKERYPHLDEAAVHAIDTAASYTMGVVIAEMLQLAPAYRWFVDMDWCNATLANALTGRIALSRMTDESYLCRIASIW